VHPSYQTGNSAQPPPFEFDQQADRETVLACKQLWDDFRDPEKFIPNALQIQTRQGTMTPFVLKKAQRRLIGRVKAKRDAGQPIRFIIDKTRRVGLSSVIAGLIFQETPFFEGQSALILAHEKKAARNLFGYYDRFEHSYQKYKGIGLPRVIGRSASQDAGSIRWANRSQIEIATAKSLDFSRSFDFRFLHLSEYAYYPSIRGLMTALIATVADDPATMVFKESTAKGYNEFYSDCIDAMEGRGDYEFFFVGCFEDEDNVRSLERDNVDPEKFVESLTDEEWALAERYSLEPEQIYWRRKKLEDFKGDLKRFDQEYPHSWEVSFQASGRQRFDPLLFVGMPTEVPFEQGELRKEEINRKEQLVFRPHQFGELTIWKRFKQGGEYIGGVDVAKGVDINDGVGTPDPDWCVAQIGERHLGEQVMELHTRIEPFPFAQYLYDLGHWCFQETGNWIYWVIECEFSGGNGLAVCRELVRLGYPQDRIYFSEVLDEANQTRKKEIGFVIRPNTRPSLISNHERYLIQRGLILHSKPTIAEHKTFVKKKTGKIEHEDGCHDDRVFGAMYLSWGFEYAPVLKAITMPGKMQIRKYGAGQKPKGPARDLEEEHWWKQQRSRR
jgi:hypothetical protein